MRSGPGSTSRAALILLIATTLLALACQREPELPTYWAAPDFALRDQANQPASRARFQGRVVLADFVYTTCEDICPLLTATMRTLQDRLKAENLFATHVALVSFTVDPERDTPEVLTRYGQAVGADFTGWTFLTGDRDELEQTLVQGFKLPFRGPGGPGPFRPGFEITHTNRVVLIDPRGQIRGLLNGEEMSVEQVVRDIRRLAG